MKKPAPIVEADNISVGYKQGRNVRKVLQNLDFKLYEGELVCLIGPNGAGKSTLLRSIMGLLPVLEGKVMLENIPSTSYSSTDLAKKISLVLASNQGANLRIDELVEMGRIPYTGWLGKLSSDDKEIVEKALELTGIQKFRGRNFQQLSDGEKQRVMLARAIAQDTPVMLLDEPTAYLDIPGRMELMLFQRHLAHVMNKAILLSTHDLHLALEMADRIWLLTDEGRLYSGLPEELLMNGNFQKAFYKEGFLFDSETGHFKVLTKERSLSVQIVSDSNLAYWTGKALLRKGFTLNGEHPEAVIQIAENAGSHHWILTSKTGNTQRFETLELLLDGLAVITQRNPLI